MSLDAMGAWSDEGRSSGALDAESATLACVLCDAGAQHRALDRIANALAPEDFAEPRNGSVWSAMLAVHARGVAVDSATVAEELRETGDKTGLQHLGALARVESDPAACEGYARLVAERAYHRATIAGLTEALATLKGTGSPLDLVSDARALLAKLPVSVRGTRDDSIRAAAEVLTSRVLAAMTDAQRGMQRTAAWGVLGLDGGAGPDGEASDGRLGGLFAGRLYILAGVPAAGKTTLAWQAVLETARGSSVRGGRRVLVFSLEMTPADLMARLAGQSAGLSESRIERGELTNDEWGVMAGELARLSDLPVNIIDDARTLERIRARVLAECARGDVGLVVVDYLQLVGMGQRYDDGNRLDADRVQGFKTLVNEAGVPILAISAMTKDAQRGAAEGKVDSTGTKGAGAEYAADVIAFLVRANPEDTSQEPLVNFVCTKRRGGPTFQHQLTFDMRRGRFWDAY